MYRNVRGRSIIQPHAARCPRDRAYSGRECLAGQIEHQRTGARINGNALEQTGPHREDGDREHERGGNNRHDLLDPRFAVTLGDYMRRDLGAAARTPPAGLAYEQLTARGTVHLVRYRGRQLLRTLLSGNIHLLARDFLQGLGQIG